MKPTLRGEFIRKGLMTNWIFTTPTVEEAPIGEHRLFYFYKLDRGVTIVRNTTGGYSQIRYPVDNELDNYPEVYRGGYQYTVNEATREALINGNVGVTTENFTQA